MLEKGDIIGEFYKIEKQIGMGQNSVVYKAINTQTRDWHTVKAINIEPDDIEAHKNLQNEINTLKRIRHPGLPYLNDIISKTADDDTVYIITEYIEGEPLDEIVAKYGAQRQENVVAWAKQLCDALEYLHTLYPSIIYRDMKPSNIILQPNGCVVLIDFGFAREYKYGKRTDTVYLGNKGYAAPEQFGGLGQTDERTDIYGLGTTLYYLITGQSPAEQPFYNLKPIRYWNSSLSIGLEKIIDKCVQQNRQERYASCAHLRWDLDHYVLPDTQNQKKQHRKIWLFIVPLILLAASIVFAFTTHFLLGFFLSVLFFIIAGGMFFGLNVPYLFSHSNNATRQSVAAREQEMFEQFMDINSKKQEKKLKRRQKQHNNIKINKNEIEDSQEFDFQVEWPTQKSEQAELEDVAINMNTDTNTNRKDIDVFFKEDIAATPKREKTVVYTSPGDEEDWLLQKQPVTLEKARDLEKAGTLKETLDDVLSILNSKDKETENEKSNKIVKFDEAYKLEKLVKVPTKKNTKSKNIPFKGTYLNGNTVQDIDAQIEPIQQEQTINQFVEIRPDASEFVEILADTQPIDLINQVNNQLNTVYNNKPMVNVYNMPNIPTRSSIKTGEIQESLNRLIEGEINLKDDLFVLEKEIILTHIKNPDIYFS